MTVFSKIKWDLAIGLLALGWIGLTVILTYQAGCEDHCALNGTALDAVEAGWWVAGLTTLGLLFWTERRDRGWRRVVILAVVTGIGVFASGSSARLSRHSLAR